MSTFQLNFDEKEINISKLKQFSITGLLNSNSSTEILQSSPGLDKSYLLGTNSFVNSVTKSYNEHHHLIIRPDDIWIAIICQFSIYLNVNAEKLRDKFVSFQGKKELEVDCNGSLRNAPYDELTLLMSTEIAKNIKDASVKDWVIPNFSTTTPTDKIVGSIALMSSLQKYFDFKFNLWCGIPRVTLLGTIDDWKSIKTRAERLSEFDSGDGLMTKWLVMLIPVLTQFIESVGGNVNVSWWNKICHYIGGGSGPTWLSGWITVFTVFNDQSKWVGDKKSKHPITSTIEKTEWLFIDTQDIPAGFLSVPVVVNDNGTIYKTKLYAGHMSTNIQQTSIQPRLDWFLTIE
ncbi:hypothetical protein DLAC_08380 [Tieghemostelium lacteum]|uniref:Uncharacterized protein n=1 Tax=Tieghemostelium lacteum TaxID=361077 RepID=A0A151ZBU5_TIELA|nr:hypothetical protein DLAC_08380 [Tieghemostelium lacteum]|eukprot:KYQ91416.1 hypothetical protein DLAC_08380 [Tieghemostelium lacteum]